eukprot:g23722.t1
MRSGHNRLWPCAPRRKENRIFLGNIDFFLLMALSVTDPLWQRQLQHWNSQHEQLNLQTATGELALHTNASEKLNMCFETTEPVYCFETTEPVHYYGRNEPVSTRGKELRSGLQRRPICPCGNTDDPFTF